MQVIAHKRLQFHRADIKPHPITGELQHLIHESYTVVPNDRQSQDVPDWIVEDELFDRAVAEESIIPVATVIPKSNKAKVTPTPTGLPTPSGWGTKGK